MNSNEKKILYLTSAAHLLTHFYILVFPAMVMPLSRAFASDHSKIVTIGFPMYLCYGAFAIPWGYLADRWGGRLMMALGMLLAGSGFVAGSVMRSADSLGLVLIPVGIGCSAYHPAGLALLSKGIRVRGRALGINGVFGNLGIASAPLVAGALTFFFGWQQTFFFLGLVGIAIGAIIFAVPIAVSADDIQKGAVVEKRKMVQLYLMLCVAMLFSGLMYRGYTVILPTYFEQKLPGLGTWAAELIHVVEARPDTATFVATVIACCVYLVGMVGQMMGGKVADRYDLRYGYMLFFLCALPFLIAMRFLEGPLLVTAAGVFILFSLGMQPIENSLVAMLTPPKWRSVSYGVKFTLVFGAGSVAVHLVGWVIGLWGLDAVVLLLALFLVLVVVTLIALLRVSRGTSIKHQKV